MSKTLFDKIWEKHVVDSIPDGPDVLYIDRHFIHEVTSPQAFTGLNKRGIRVFRPGRVFASPDHNVPTINQHLPIQDKLSRLQVEKLTENCPKMLQINPLRQKYKYGQVLFGCHGYYITSFLYISNYTCFLPRCQLFSKLAHNHEA